MKSMLIAGLTAGFSSLIATAALAACPGAGCAYAPASPHYAFGPLPAYAAAPAYAPQAYGPPAYPAPQYEAPPYARGRYGPPPSYGSPPPYAPQGYGQPDRGPAHLPPPPYRRGEGQREDYGPADYGRQDYGRSGYERGEYDALGENAPVLGEPAYGLEGWQQQDSRAYQEHAYRQSFHQSPDGYPPGYPCMSCAAPPAVYYPQPCHRPAYVCVAPPETVSLQGDFFTGGVGDTGGAYGGGGGGWGGGNNFVYSGGLVSDRIGARASASASASVSVSARVHASARGGWGGHGGHRGGGCNSCGGGKKGGRH